MPFGLVELAAQVVDDPQVAEDRRPPLGPLLRQRQGLLVVTPGQAGPDAASAAASLSYLLLSFCSGLFIPLSQLPQAVRDVARFLPTYHFAQLAWGALGASDETMAASIGWLFGWTVFFFGAAYRRYSRDQQKRFG